MTKPLFSSPPLKTVRDKNLPESSTNRVIQKEAYDYPGAEAAAEAFDSLDDDKAGQLPIERFEDLLEELGEGFHGEELDAQLKLVDPDVSNSIQREAFIKWYCGLISADEDYADQELDEDEVEEREEERQRVLAVFKVFSTDDGKSINMDLFPKFMKKIGTTYAEEVHGRAAKSMEGPPGSIAWKAFEAWYIPWLFEGDDESDEEAQGDRADESFSGRSAVADGWGGIFGKPKGWKCDVCMIQNEDDKKKCVSCETVRPGFEADMAKQGTSTMAAAGTSSFSFGVPSASALPASSTLSFGGSTFKPQVSSGFSFGSPPVSETSSLKAPVSSGFSFGVAQGIKVEPQSAFGFGVVKGDKAAPQGSFASGAPASDTKMTKPISAGPAPGTGYPPMSSKAPSNPFGSGKPDAAKADSFKNTVMASSTVPVSGYPPISSKAPSNPFGSIKPDTAKEDSSNTTAVPGSAIPAPASGYPPMSSKAPSNPFASSTPEAAKADSSNGPNYGALLMKVYQDHEPSKIPDIPALLKKYKGKEEVMLERLRKSMV
ncbi:hypothetical protein MHU86_20313 [Fragilaria crotonensis]|nr:hypothetical protein MHU86_20313 [Fragilaria crotonensis]